jgi:hypothetical protein
MPIYTVNVGNIVTAPKFWKHIGDRFDKKNRYGRKWLGASDCRKSHCFSKIKVSGQSKPAPTSAPVVDEAVLAVLR